MFNTDNDVHSIFYGFLKEPWTFTLFEKSILDEQQVKRICCVPIFSLNLISCCFNNLLLSAFSHLPVISLVWIPFHFGRFSTNELLLWLSAIGEAESYWKFELSGQFQAGRHWHCKKIWDVYPRTFFFLLFNVRNSYSFMMSQLFTDVLKSAKLPEF